MLKIEGNDPKLKIVGVDSGGGDIYHYDNYPFTGVLFENYPNGNIAYEIECVNGYPEGKQKHYFINGQINEEYLFKHNLTYGLTREWDEKGNLINEYDLGPEP